MIKTKKVTLKQISAAANLAVPTVSQILNGRRNYCSEEQIVRVKKLAEEMGYQPNIGYKIMIGEKTKTVAILFSQERTFHTEEIQNLTIRLVSELEKRGESVYAVTMSNCAEANRQRILELVNRGCAAFILLGTPVGEKSLIDLIEKQDLDYVSLNNSYSKNDITVDQDSVFRRYAANVIRRGMKRVAYVMFEGYFRIACSGSVETLRAAGGEDILYAIETSDGLPFDCSDFLFGQSYQAVKAALERGETARAWFFADDYLALGGVKALTEAGFRIGRDVWVFGMHNTRAGRFSVCPVNTSSPMTEEILVWLLEHLKSPDRECRNLVPDILIRS